MSVFPVSSEGLPPSVASYNTQEDVEYLIYSNLGPLSVAFYDTRGCGGSFLTWVLMGCMYFGHKILSYEEKRNKNMYSLGVEISTVFD
jgi:hypothetical protein